MINYSYYPVLEGARTDISEFDEQSILYARDNIEKYKPTKILDIDISVFLISTIILHNLKNKFLIRKFVTNYGKLFETHFRTDIKDKEVRKAVLYHLNVLKNDLKIPDKNRVSLHMNDYLEIALEVSDRHPQFLLVNSDLDKGFVHLDTPKFAYLCRLVVESKLYEKIKNGMKDYYGDERINQIVLELGGKYPETKKKVQVNTSVPESIQVLINKAYSEHELTHRERIKLGIYLQGQEYEWDYIIEIFSQLSDFNLKTTTYQLKSLRRYIKP